MIRSVLRAAPWTRALWLTLRSSPGSFLACVLSGAVLCAVAASGPLFLASARTAGLHNEASQACPEQSRPAISDDAGPAAYPSAAQAPTRLARSDAEVRTAAANAGLTSPYRVSTATVAVSSTTTTGSAFLFHRAGSTTHVVVVAGHRGRLLVPASYAASAHVRVGSRVTVGRHDQRIDGIYRDLAPSAFEPLFALPRYWCAWTDSIVPTPFDRPPPMFLVGDPVMIAAGASIVSKWFDPTPIGTRTAADASRAVAVARDAVRAVRTAGFRFDSQLPSQLTKASKIETGLRGPVVPILVAAVLIAAVLVMAGASFWSVRRHREIRLLASRGVGPVPIGLKAALELLPALVLGCLIGWLGAIQIVRTTGPSSLLEPGAPARALRAAAAAAAVGLLLVGVVGARAGRTDRRRARRRWLRTVPWELLLGAAGVVAYVAIRRDGAVRLDQATVQISPLVVAFPLIALSAALVLLTRVIAGGLPLLRRVDPRSTSVYLALRRVGRTPSVAVGVLVGVALPVALFTYSVALSGSTRDDVAAKYRASIGAPQALGLLTHGHDPRPARLGTVVGLIQTDAVTETGTEVTVLGADPDTFSRFAYGGADLDQAMRIIGRRAADAPALLVNASGIDTPHTIAFGGATLRVDVRARRATFPGLRDPYRPMIVVNRTSLPAAGPTVSRSDELWTTTDDVQPALDVLNRQGVDANYAVSPRTFLNSSGLLPVTWLFEYLQSVALLTAVVGLAGLAYAYASRTRSRARTYHLARRMGLSRASHRLSLAAELAAVVGASWATGVLLALGAIRSVYLLTDTYPSIPPPPRFPSVVAPLAITATGAAFVVLAATFLLQHLSERASPTELLRA